MIVFFPKKIIILVDKCHYFGWFFVFFSKKGGRGDKQRNWFQMYKSEMEVENILSKASLLVIDMGN